MNILSKSVTVDSYHQYFLPEYSGVEMFINCKHSHRVLARISSQGHLEVFKGYSYPLFSFADKGSLYNALLVRSVLVQLYNKHHGNNFYTRRDINIIFCNTMKQCGVKYICRKVCYFGSVCYSMWEKFIRGY